MAKQTTTRQHCNVCTGDWQTGCKIIWVTPFNSDGEQGETYFSHFEEKCANHLGMSDEQAFQSIRAVEAENARIANGDLS